MSDETSTASSASQWPINQTLGRFVDSSCCSCVPTSSLVFPVHPSDVRCCSFGGPCCMHLCSALFIPYYICEHDSLYAACSPGRLPCGLCMRICTVAPCNPSGKLLKLKSFTYIKACACTTSTVRFTNRNASLSCTRVEIHCTLLCSMLLSLDSCFLAGKEWGCAKFTRLSVGTEAV